MVREVRLLLDAEPYIASGVDIDFKAPFIQTEKLTTMCARLDEILPFADNSFDVVPMLAGFPLYVIHVKGIAL